MTTKKKRLTSAELERMPKDRFPLQVKTDGLDYAQTIFETICIMSGVQDNCGKLAIMDSSGKYNLMSVDRLKEYPSFEPDEPDEIEWFQVISMRKGDVRPEPSRFLYKSKEHFLTTNGYKESDYQLIDLILIKKYPDYSEDK